GKCCPFNITDSRKVLNDLVFKHVDSGGNIHVFQKRFLYEASTVVLLVHLDQSEGKPRVDNSDCGQRTVLPMFRQHGLELEVGDLVAIQSEECLIINVTGYS